MQYHIIGRDDRLEKASSYRQRGRSHGTFPEHLPFPAQPSLPNERGFSPPVPPSRSCRLQQLAACIALHWAVFFLGRGVVFMFFTLPSKMVGERETGWMACPAEAGGKVYPRWADR